MWNPTITLLDKYNFFCFWICAAQQVRVGINLKEMLEFTYKEEEFDQDNKYFCEKCNKMSSKATKRIKITKLPKFLVVTLNRFQFDRKLVKKVKLNYKVEIDFETEFNSDFIEI